MDAGGSFSSNDSKVIIKEIFNLKREVKEIKLTLDEVLSILRKNSPLSRSSGDSALNVLQPRDKSRFEESDILTVSVVNGPTSLGVAECKEDSLAPTSDNSTGRQRYDDHPFIQSDSDRSGVLQITKPRDITPIISDGEDTDSETDEGDTEEAPVVAIAEQILPLISDGRSQVNFGQSLRSARPSSPLPAAREKINVPSTSFKRRKTDEFEDNRHCYFSKAMDIINMRTSGYLPSTFGSQQGNRLPDQQVSVMRPQTVNVTVNDSIQVEKQSQLTQVRLQAEAQQSENAENITLMSSNDADDVVATPQHTKQPPSTVSDDRVSSADIIASPGSSPQQNNRMITDCGLKNNHGQKDNRNDVAAHDDDDFPHFGSRSRNVLSNFSQLTCGKAENGEMQTADTVELDRSGQDAEEFDDEEPDDTDTFDLETLIEQQKNSAKGCTDAKSQGVDTVICLDISGSMEAMLGHAKKAILAFIDEIEQNVINHDLEENVALVTFGASNTIVQHLTNDYDKIRDALDTIEAGGSSPLIVGLALSLTEIAERGGQCDMSDHSVLPRILLITDGFATDDSLLSAPETSVANKEVDSKIASLVDKNSQIVDSISCIFLLKINQESLATITKSSGGRLVPASKVTSLCSFFRIHTKVNQVYSKIKGRLEVVTESEVKKAIKESFEDGDPEDFEEVLKILRVKYLKASSPPQAHAPSAPTAGTRIRLKSSRTSEEFKDGIGKVGTVTFYSKKGYVHVVWDDGADSKLKYGDDADFDIVDEPCLLEEGENIRIGIKVERGPDWRWKDQDGGPGSVGIVTTTETNKVVHVTWQNGQSGNYRYGYCNKYDITVCDGQRKVINIMGEQGAAVLTHICWRYQDAMGEWSLFSPEASQNIEKVYQSKPKSTVLVEAGGYQYRILLSWMQARNLSKPSTQISNVERVELTEEEMKGMKIK